MNRDLSQAGSSLPEGKREWTSFVYEERTWPDWWYQLVVDFKEQSVWLSVEQCFSGQKAEERKYICSPGEWQTLMQLFDLCRINGWLSRYEAPVLDGTTWNVTIRRGEEAVREIFGCNAWPENWESFAEFRAECCRLAGIGIPCPDPSDHEERKLF